MNALELLWLVPALPFLGAAVNGLLLRNRQKSLVTAVGVGAPGLSLAIALTAIWQYATTVRPEAFEQVLWNWTTGALAIDIGFRLDPGWGIWFGHIVFLALLAVRPQGLFPKTRG